MQLLQKKGEDRLLQLVMVLSVLRHLPDLFLPSLSQQSSLEIVTGSSEAQLLHQQQERVLYESGVTREQAINLISRQLLARLRPEVLRSLLDSQDPGGPHLDYEHPMDGLHDSHHHSLGNLMGESPWSHHSPTRTGGGFKPGLDPIRRDSENWNDLPMKGFDALIREHQATLILHRINALANGNGNAWLNGILRTNPRPDGSVGLLEDADAEAARMARLNALNGGDSDAAGELKTGATELNERPSDPTAPDEGGERTTSGARALDNLRNTVNAFLFLGQTSAVPNSTSSNGLGNILQPLVNPTPPPTPPPSMSRQQQQQQLIPSPPSPPNSPPNEPSTSGYSSTAASGILNPISPPSSDPVHHTTPPMSPLSSLPDSNSDCAASHITDSSAAEEPVVRTVEGEAVVSDEGAGNNDWLGLVSSAGLEVNGRLFLPPDLCDLSWMDDLHPEDRRALQQLWMSDHQDLGVACDAFEEAQEDWLLQEALSKDPFAAGPPLKDVLLKPEQPIMLSGAARDGGGGGGQPGQPMGVSSLKLGAGDDSFSGINCTLDSETGEFLLLSDSDDSEPKRDLLYAATDDDEELSKELLKPYSFRDICELKYRESNSSHCNSSSRNIDDGRNTTSDNFDPVLPGPLDPLSTAPVNPATTSNIFQEAANALINTTQGIQQDAVLPSEANLETIIGGLTNEELLETVSTIQKLEQDQEVYDSINQVAENLYTQVEPITANTAESAVLPPQQQEHVGFTSDGVVSDPLPGVVTEVVLPPAGEIASDAARPASESDSSFQNDFLGFDINEELPFDEICGERDEAHDADSQSVVNDSWREHSTDLELSDQLDSRASSSSSGRLSRPAQPVDNLAASSALKLKSGKSSKRRRAGRVDKSYSTSFRQRRPSACKRIPVAPVHSTPVSSDALRSSSPPPASLQSNRSRHRSSRSSSGHGTLSPQCTGSYENSPDYSELSVGEYPASDLSLEPGSVDLGSLASFNTLNSSLDEMIQASFSHPRGTQGRMGGMLRGGSMDQRWQDLASLLSLPSPTEPTTTTPPHPHHHHPSPHTPHTPSMTTALHHPHHQAPPPHMPPPSHHQQQTQPTIHHPHALYPAHDGVGGPGGNVPRAVGGLLHNATLPPTMPDPVTHNITYANSMGASSHLVSSSLNLSNNTSSGAASDHMGDHQQHHHHHHQHHHQYKMENSSLLPPPPPPPPPPPHHDMLYYQSGGGSSGGGGELGGTGGGAHTPATGDGFLSSILGEEDLQLMDMAIATDYPRVSNPSSSGSSAVLSPHSSSLTPGTPADYSNNTAYRGWNLSPEEHQRLAAPVAQKKHQMYGKRYFQDSTPPHPQHGTNSSLLNSAGSSHYPSHYSQPPTSAMDTTPAPPSHIQDPMELKYSCSMDFRGHHSDVNSPLEHVQHNHTYHMSPEGPSGLPRPTQRDQKNKVRKTEPERTLTRDEKRARSLNLPISCEDIIHLPMDEFNERISKYDLTEPQLSLIRDIRRRGKNKVAAQNCRKRKLDQIMHLAEEVKVIQSRKNELNSQYDFLSGERLRVKHKFSLLYRHIFQHLRDSDGQPYSPHEYNLQQSADGSVLLVPRSSPHLPLDPGLPPPPHHPNNNNNKQEDDSKNGQHHPHHHQHHHQQQQH